jgi:hypothetical protein
VAVTRVRNKIAYEEACARNAWRLREAKATHDEYQAYVADAALSSVEALPEARPPEFEEDDDRPLTPQGRALRARRREP